ncbi:hypothetical protein [Alteromonas sp. ASW11-130]|uniref:hypothetical protein n=1 Tax=Alteromonas sp. ASW11-130 TaxID=3015775 RepID=UPI002242C586|nr:hypothetical protein [Alteromonas sp. ASW11-130]MCW8091525.1 hypothetical protein [Alteromonas sp. ASW11-130]
MKLLSAWLAVILCVSSCQMNDSTKHTVAPANAQETELSNDFHIAAPVSVFSTYVSEESRAKCKLITAERKACIDDAIEASYFFRALKNSGAFPNALAASEESDYQILVANQAATIASPSWWNKSFHTLTGATAPLTDERVHFTELTVQWRGLEIDSLLIETHLSMTDVHTPKTVAETVIASWWSHALKKGLFTAQYLFKALNASDYLNEMRVPETIETFTRFDTQLFHDPFQGAITRYTHNEFEDALLDISVFPLTGNLDASIEATLISVLEKEQSDAQIVAQARNLSLLVDQPIAEFTKGKELISDKVYMLALHADGERTEPIFATTYVFRQQDKIVKVSTTFPPRIADPLVKQALPSIKVPSESPLMSALREMAKARNTVN